MLFNSVEFVVFLIVVFVVHWFLLKEKPLAQKIWLLLVSCFFYMYLIPVYILILFLTIVVDYGAGIMIERSSGKRRKVYLVVSIVSTCLILAVFKYFDFFLQNINDLAALFGWNYSVKLLGLLLPIGLSFHTFQSLAYVIDVYRNQQKAEYNFINYSLYVMYFPQLVAGPIERATHILPQIQKERKFSYDQAYLGMRLILWGLFKKVVVADSLAEYANYAFAHYQTEGTATLVLGIIYFAFQIYCDFSGYSDIAIGTSRLFGIELMRNFNVPYFSKSIAEFWRKWHISLSYWFRDYVYIPLGGSVENPFWRFRNLLVVFLLSGFWHGANWTYVVWGLVHVLFYIPSVFFGKSNRKKGYLDMIGTFLIVCLAWIFFRASSIDEAFGYIKHMVLNYQNWDSLMWFSRGLILLIPFILIEWINRENSTGIPFIQFNWSKPVQMAYETVLAVLIIISFYTLDLSNLSTSNSDLNRFVRGFLKRLGILSVVLAGIFFISFDRSYYYSIPKDTTYHKVYWVYNRLMQGMDEQNVLFMGSSICQNGINDSLLNQWDEGANHYYNFGVTHSCNAITYELLKEVLEYRGERPSKVYLCLKSDARPTKFHAMFPVIASSGDLLESAGESNVYLLPTLLKRVAWNGFGATQIYTMPKVDRNNELGDDYGYIPSKPVDSTEVIRIYNQEKENVSGVMRHYEATLSGEDKARGFLSRMNRKRMNLFSNSDFQDVYFEKCAALLEAYSIPFDIIVYPNYGITVAGNSAMTGQYYQQYYSQIDYEKHRVISLQLEALKSPSAWRDMNHLSKEGATIFTRALLDTLGH